MRTVALVHRKGGTAKTTTAVNLGAALGELGQSVLLLDLDPQANLSHWLDVPSPSPGLEAVFTEDVEIRDGTGRRLRPALADLITTTTLPNVSAIPSTPALLSLERTLASEPGAETILRSALKTVRSRFDWLLIDTPPALGILTISALVAVRELLVPVETTILGLEGLADLQRTVEHVRKHLNKALTLRWVVPVKVSHTKLSREVIDALRGRYGGRVTTTTIRHSVKVQEAPSWSQPVTTYAKHSPAAKDYRALAVEVSAKPTDDLM